MMAYGSTDELMELRTENAELKRKVTEAFEDAVRRERELAEYKNDNRLFNEQAKELYEVLGVDGEDPSHERALKVARALKQRVLQQELAAMNGIVDSYTPGGKG